MKSIIHLSLLGALGLSLAACGQSPETLPPVSPPLGARPAPPLRGPAFAPLDQVNNEGEWLKQNATRAFMEAKGLGAEIKSYTEGYYKQGERVSERRISQSRLRMVWMKPNKMWGRILETTNPLLRGGEMASTDGVNITARAGGLLGLFAVHLQASDKKLRSSRNWSHKEGNPDFILQRYASPSTVWTVTGESRVENVPVKVVELSNLKPMDPGITRELIYVDPVAFTVRRLVMYHEGNRRAVDYTFVKFTWNPHATEATFKI